MPRRVITVALLTVLAAPAWASTGREQQVGSGKDPGHGAEAACCPCSGQQPSPVNGEAPGRNIDEHPEDYQAG